MEQNKNLYLIKSLAPWMMEELIAFSRFSKFRIIFLRDVPDFYTNDLKVLKENGIEYFIKPFKYKLNFRLFFYLLNFLLKNISKLFGKQNLIWTINGMFWFLFLDKKLLENISTIHAQFASQATITAYFIKKRFKKNYFFTFHAHDIYFKNKWFPLLVNESEYSFSISEFNIKYIANHYKELNINKVKLVRLGVYLPPNIVKEKQADNKWVLGFMSNLEEKKGIPFLLAAFKIVHDKNPEKYELQIAGSGDYMTEIEQFIKTHNLSNVIKVLGRIRDQKKIDFYQQTDVFVLPSIRTKNDMDGIPVVLMESISYAKPIISTNISGIPEICINEYDGFLIDEKNTNQLADAIEKITESTEIYKKFTVNSLELAKQEYDLVKNSKNKLKLMGWIKD